MQLFSRGLRDDLDSAIQGVIFVQQLQISTAAAKHFGKHLAKIRPHFCKCVCEKLLGGRIDPGDHIEQFTPRICQVRVLRFEKAMAFFQFIILLDGIEIDRSHAVELTRQLRYQFLKIIIGRRWESCIGAFQLGP